MNYPENWPDGYCQVQPEPGAHCFEPATKILHEPYTPAAFKVACCPEHAESLKRAGYSSGTRLEQLNLILDKLDSTERLLFCSRMIGSLSVSSQQQAWDRAVEIAEEYIPKSELATCDGCSQPSAELTEVDDSDRSVGYYSVLQLCPECLKRRMS